MAVRAAAAACVEMHCAFPACSLHIFAVLSLPDVANTCPAAAGAQQQSRIIRECPFGLLASSAYALDAVPLLSKSREAGTEQTGEDQKG